MSDLVPADVRAVMIDSSAPDDTINFWISWADDLVSRAYADVSTSTVPDATRTLVTKLVAAHGVAAADPTESDATVGDVRYSYEGEAGDGLKETRYGRRALATDPTGALAGVTQPDPSFESFGTSYDARAGWRR